MNSMKIIALCFLIFLSVNHSTFGQISFDNGLTFYTDSSKTNLCNGVFRKFYPGFKIRTMTNYLDGKLEGECIEYFINGQIKNQLNFKNSLLNGEIIEYYEETLVIKNRYIFVNGLKNGESFSYNTNGEVLERKIFVNDILQ